MISTKEILRDLVALELHLEREGKYSWAGVVLEARERLRVLYEMLDSVSEREVDNWVRDRLECEEAPS